MYDVKGHLHQILDTLPQGTRLVAISKYHPNEYIMAAYEEGQRVFGESHEQELRQKHKVSASRSQLSIMLFWISVLKLPICPIID